MKKHNFCSGPAILPKSVFEEASNALLDFNGSGLSILEISHRSNAFTAVINETKMLVKAALSLDEQFEVIFLSGGATSQFFMTAMNLLNDGEKAAYIDTGVWSQKAIKEAGAYGTIQTIASSKDKGYAYIPKSYEIPTDARFLHITTNNTIYGTQFKKIPDTGVPIVADMSSDIFSKPIDGQKFGLIYAGAQKNMGAAGTTLVIVRKDMLGRVSRHIPAMLDYQAHIKKNSALNTPPVFPIYVSMLTLRWLQTAGGVEAMEAKNNAKAALLYEEIDRNGCFEGRVAPQDRSVMNATFVLKNEQLNEAFSNYCEKAGIVAINGHRLAGGFRASMYNAMDISSVQYLVEVMQAFEQQFG